MQTQPTLEHVSAQFEHWRQSRRNSSERIPDSLRRQTVALIEHYPLSHVMHALRVNSTQLKTWRNEADHPKEQTVDFISLSIASEPEHSRPLKLELVLPGGCQMRLEGDLGPELLCALAQSLSDKGAFL